MLENRSNILETQLEGDVKLSELKKNIEQKVRQRFKATCDRIAELKAGRNAGWKHRARAISAAVGISGSRAKTIIYDEHRSVHAHEYIIAERTVETLELKAAEQRAVRGMEMGFDALNQVDCLDSDWGRTSMSSAPEMSQEVRIRMAGV